MSSVNYLGEASGVGVLCSGFEHLWVLGCSRWQSHTLGQTPQIPGLQLEHFLPSLTAWRCQFPGPEVLSSSLQGPEPINRQSLLCHWCAKDIQLSVFLKPCSELLLPGQHTLMRILSSVGFFGILFLYLFLFIYNHYYSKVVPVTANIFLSWSSDLSLWIERKTHCATLKHGPCARASQL